MANIFEFLSKDENITPQKARKSGQMQFHDKTSYVWGLRYRWDPSLSRNPVPRLPHFMPPWHEVNLCIWVARIFIKYLWQSLGQSGCFGENIKFSNVTLKGHPCCLEDELKKIEESLASTYAHMYTCPKNIAYSGFQRKATMKQH